MGDAVQTKNYFGALALTLCAMLLSACGGGAGSGRIGGSTGGVGGGTTGSTTGGATTGGTSTPNLQMGTLVGGTFTAGAMLIGQTPLAAGGASGLRVDVVDLNAGNALYTAAPISVVFNSSCISQGLATVTSPVVTSTGSASSTYVARGCSGSDTISATATANGQSLSASGAITVQPAALGSLRFVDAKPTMIGVRGAGQTEASTLVFQLLDATGGPVVNRAITFSLNTSVGGVTINPVSGNTDNSGNIQTTVSSGTVPTVVRVTAATVNPANGQTISTQSSGLVISTGIPDQDSFSLSVATHNLEGDNQDGITATVTARLADRFNNPVFDGTAVSFTTEGGSIGPSCTTLAGACSVTFTTQNPRTRDLAAPGTAVYTDNNCGTLPNQPSNARGCNDHRYTILATAIGEESFTDTNGNGFYDAGEPFNDLAEPFLDSNENGLFDTASETLANGDFNRNGIRDPASGNFTGVLCNSGCDTVQSLNVFAQQIIVMSSTTARVTASPNPIIVAAGGNAVVTVSVSDLAGQNMAAGTTVTATSTIGTVTAIGPTTLADTTLNGPAVFQFSLAAPTTTGAGTFTVSVTAPSSSVVTPLSVPVTVQ